MGFSRIEKDMQIQEAQEISSNLNKKNYTLKHIILKVKITERNDKILRAAIEKSQLPVQK